MKTTQEIDICAEIGLWGVTILVGINDKVLTNKRTGQYVIDRCKELLARARKRDLHVTFMGMDCTRTTPAFLEKVVVELDPYFDEYVIADSLGRITPFGIRYLSSLVCQWTKKPLQLHPHNTTSMAVGNCLGAVLGGVISADKKRSKKVVTGYTTERQCQQVVSYETERYLKNNKIYFTWNGINGSAYTFNNYNIGTQIPITISIQAK